MTSEACQFSTLDRRTEILNKSTVFSSHLTRVTAENSKIVGSIISTSFIQDALITGGEITLSEIKGAELICDYVKLNKARLHEGVRAAHTAYIHNSFLKNWTIFGDAQIIDWGLENAIDGHEGYIGRGIWCRQIPRILDLNGLTITEGVPGFAYCGCLEFEIDHWLKIGDRYGKKLGLSVEDVDKIRQFLLTLR